MNEHSNMTSPLFEVYEMFEEYMDEMDWEKIRKVMEFTDWKWADGDGTTSFPSTGDMRKQVRDLLRKALKESIDRKGEMIHSSTGGFEVCVSFDIEEKEEYTKDNVYFDIKFVLEWVSNY